MIKSLISTAMAGIPRTGTSGKEPSKFVLNAAKNMAASIPISNKKATIPVPKKKEEKDNKILDAMIKNRIETIKPKIRGTVSVGAQEYSKNPFDLIDFLFEARKECIENYPILNWNSNLLKGGIGSIKKGGTKLGKKYGTYLYEKKIPFVSDMVGEFHGVRKETKKSTAGSVTGALFKGVLVDGFGGTVEGVANIVADPLETVGGLVKIAANPKETASAIWNVVKETWDKKVIHGTSEERAVLAGQAVFEIGSLFVGVGETKAAASGAKAADITGDVGKITSKSRRIIKKVEKVKGKASKIGKGISYKKPIPKSNPQNVTVKLDEVISSLLKKSGDGLDELRKGINRVMNGEMEYSGIGKLDEVGETGDKIVGKLDDWKKAIQDNLKKAEKKESGVQISGPKGNGKGGKLTIVDEGVYSQSEINAAQYVADLGNDVTLRPPVGTRADGGTSDLLVNGINYDVYTPVSNNPSAIIRAMTKKNTQTTGIVLDLSKTTVTSSDLGNSLARIKGAIEKNGGTCNINDIIIMPK